MRLALLLGLLVHAGVVAAQPPPGPGPTRGTEVFTGAADVVQPREKPDKPVTTYWQVQLFVKIGPASAGAHAQVLLPLSDPHQEILSRRVDAPGFAFDEEPEPPNLSGNWTRVGDGSAAGQITYEFTAAVTDTIVDVPHRPLAEAEATEPLRPYLRPSDMVQSADADIRRRARDLTRDVRTVDEAAWALFQYTAAFVRAAGGEARQDALTVLRDERGNTSGKARLLTALLRSLGIPARLVGGLKLEDATKKRATISWVEAHLDGTWVPLDPSGGYFGWIPNQYLALYRHDLPLIVHTSGVPLEYDFLVHRTSREASAAAAEPTPAVAAGRAETRVGGERVRTAASYVERPVASVVVIADQSVPDAVIERMLHEAQADEINVVLLHARFESRYFREIYLQRLIANNLGLIRAAHVLLIATRDDAGLYGLMTLGEKQLALDDMRIVVAGTFPRDVGRVLGAVLYRLVDAGEVILVPRAAGLLGLWEMVRANVINGVPMAEEAKKWELKPLVLNQHVYEDLGWWRRLVVDAWARAVRAQVPLQALNLILVLPVIAAIIVVVRTIIGIETFGTFSPVIVSLAFLTTGLRWGSAIFAVIVGVGAFVRALLQRVRLQLVARLAILIAVVAGIMAGLTVLGASFGIGALMNVSIFPMVIMSNVIENFTTSQAQFGTREAVRLTINTLVLSALCYVVIESTGLQSRLLTYPEILVAAIVVDVVLGKWRGLRLLEYVRFFDLTRRSDRWAP
jgi:transglutaminase-like putative cysteine protease